MPTLRNKVNKRKSDSFVLDNAKSRKIASGTVIKRNVQVPVTVQLKSLKEAHEALLKVNEENLKEIEDLKLQVALLVHERSLLPELQGPVNPYKNTRNLRLKSIIILSPLNVSMKPTVKKNLRYMLKENIPVD